MSYTPPCAASNATHIWSVEPALTTVKQPTASQRALTACTLLLAFVGAGSLLSLAVIGGAIVLRNPGSAGSAWSTSLIGMPANNQRAPYTALDESSMPTTGPAAAPEIHGDCKCDSSSSGAVCCCCSHCGCGGQMPPQAGSMEHAGGGWARDSHGPGVAGGGFCQCNGQCCCCSSCDCSASGDAAAVRNVSSASSMTSGRALRERVGTDARERLIARLLGA